MGVAKHTITPRLSLSSTRHSPFPLSSLISLSYVLMLVKKLIRKLDNLPWLDQEAMSVMSCMLPLMFNCIDKPDKIVRVTGNWTEGGISLFEWSKLAEVCIQILKSVCHWNGYKILHQQALTALTALLLPLVPFIVSLVSAFSHAFLSAFLGALF